LIYYNFGLLTETSVEYCLKSGGADFPDRQLDFLKNGIRRLLGGLEIEVKG